MIGATIGAYEVVAKLGEGGMGAVYRARDTRLGRDVAIKVLPADAVADKARLARFESEAKAVSALNHPNIVTLYEVGTSSTGPYLVLELVDGESLREIIARGPVALRRLLDLGAQIAAGLAKAHAAGVVHRDLKPDNVMVTRDGFAKILDFGLARLVWPDEGLNASDDTATFVQTASGVILGTLGYLSPEQASGKPADFRADEFALGALLYEMATAVRPFKRATTLESLTATVQSEPEPLRDKRPDLPAPLLWLIDRCLAKNPDDRYASTKDLARDLADMRDRLSHATSVRGAADGTFADSKTGRTARLAAFAALAVVAGVLLFLGGRMWSAARLQAPASEWQGERLGGAMLGLEPVISPDGQTLAFQAIVNNTTQVGVMNPAAAGWRVLTDDRTRGPIVDLCWSADGTRIFFDRLFDVAEGIFSVSVFGEGMRPVLDNAAAPRALRDGSLLVTRINANRARQLYRFWPAATPLHLEPLGAMPDSQVLSPAVQPFPDGREAVFYGRPADTPTVPNHLYAIDLTSGRTRRLAPQLSIPEASPGAYFPLAVSDTRVFFVLPAGDLNRIVSVPRDGSAGVDTILTLSHQMGFLQAGPDGSLYADQVIQPFELLRYSPVEKRIEERTPLGSDTITATNDSMPLPDGRALVAIGGPGRSRVMVVAHGRASAPFVDTTSETSAPMALVGVDRVALLMGSAPDVKVAIVSVADGRVVRLLKGVDGNAVTALAGSPDGRQVYYASAGRVWVVPSDDGAPKMIHEGDAVAVDPLGQYVVVQVKDAQETRLLRVPLGGGPAEPIVVSSDHKLAPNPFEASAIARDGRILVRIVSPDSWYWPTGILDPRTGRIEPLAIGEGIDYTSGWTADGKILGVGSVTIPSLWRFRPIEPRAHR